MMKYHRQAIPRRQRAPGHAGTEVPATEMPSAPNAPPGISNHGPGAGPMDPFPGAATDKRPDNPLNLNPPWETSLSGFEPRGYLSDFFPFVSRHWLFSFFVLLLVLTVVAWVAAGISPTYPFQEIKQRERRLEHEREKFAREKDDYQDRRKVRDVRRKIAARQRELGSELLDSGLYTDAEESFAMALALDDADWRAALGHFKAQTLRLAASDGYDPAVTGRRLEMLLKDNSEDPHAHAMLGELLSHVEPEIAETHYRRALAAKPGAAHAHFGLAEMLTGRGDYRAARALLEKAAALAPQRPVYHTRLAYVLTRIEDFPAAVKHYRHALALDGERILNYFELAGALRMARELEEAHAHHQTGVGLLERKQISALPENQASWYFYVTPAHALAGYPDEIPYTVYLDRREQKRVYGHMELAASEFLLGHEEEARRLMASLPELPERERHEIEWLVTQELQALAKNQQYLAGPVAAFLKMLE